MSPLPSFELIMKVKEMKVVKKKEIEGKRERGKQEKRKENCRETFMIKYKKRQFKFGKYQTFKNDLCLLHIN